MDYIPLYRVIYDEKDINKECKFCIQDKSKRHGYECSIKYGKRKMKRCSRCYFGANKITRILAR